MSSDSTLAIDRRERLAAAQQARLDLLARAALQLAGFKPAHARKAHRRTVEALDAVTVKRSHDRDGQLVREVRDVDHYARMAAARAILQMIPGAYPSQGAGMERSEGAQINVQIILQSTNGEQRVVDISAQQGENVYQQ